MADEDFHEIQLNGKQMFFLFMAGTVVAVVIFLIGVQVGRNVETARAATIDPAEIAAADPTAPPPADPTARARSTAATPAAGTSGAAGDAADAETTQRKGPVVAQEELTYAERLEDTSPPDETLNEPLAPPKAVPAPVSVPERQRAASDAAPASASAGPAAAPEPAGNGYVVQIAAVKTRAEADTIARRLSSKGYPSFVTTPGASAPAFFRVRVGKYADRREAERVANRLEREDQFKPWITR